MIKKFIVLCIVIMCSISVFSEDIIISESDYAKLPQSVKNEIQKSTINGELQTYSNYANLGKEIGTAVNETLKAVEESTIRISNTKLGKTAIFIVIWKLLYKELIGFIIGFILLILSIITSLRGSYKLSKNSDDEGVIINIISAIIFFIASMACIFGV